MQIIVREPEEKVDNVKDEHAVTNVHVKENITPTVNEAASLLALLEMKERERLIMPPKFIYSKFIERELAKRRTAGNVTITSDD